MTLVRGCFCALLIAGLAACPRPDNRPPLTNPPVMDLVVGDMGLQTAKANEDWRLEHAKILVYFDALNAALGSPGNQPAPDLVLGVPETPEDESGFSIGNPVDVEINDGDLYVVDQRAKRIYIWRDYRGHHDGDPPDVILLDNVEEGQSPWELLIVQNCLLVSDMYRGLLVWKNAFAVQTDDLPDVVIAPSGGDASGGKTLDYAGKAIIPGIEVGDALPPRSMLAGMAVDDAGNLFISWLSGGLYVYYDFLSEYLVGAPIVADTVLSGPSFNYMAAPIWKILVKNNVLYAHTHSSSSTLFAFSPADGLTNNQAPDAMITPTLGRLEHPFSMAVAGDTLFVGNMYSDTVGVCGFRPADALTTGQQPSLMLDSVRSAMGPCSNLCVEKNILLATSSTLPVCGKYGSPFLQDINIGDVHIFGHADQIADGDQADLVIKGGLDFLVPLSIDAAVVPESKVLLVQSYYSDYPWVNSITEGVRQGLKGSGAQVEVFYMDTKRRTSLEWKQEAGRLAAAKVDTWKPDVVIAADDNAQEYFAAQYAGAEGAPQVVFCGVNAEPEKYGYPAANVTGLLERPFWNEAVGMLLKIAPGVKKIALLTDDSGTSDDAVAFIRRQEQQVELVSVDQPETFAQWQEAVTRYQTAVDAFGIYVYHTVKREAGQDSMVPKEVMAWTVAHNTKPLFAMFSFAVEDGALCGMCESGQEHGQWAGQTAVKILAGKQAGDFPIETAKKSSPMVNLTTAAALGIKIPASVLRGATTVGAAP